MHPYYFDKIALLFQIIQILLFHLNQNYFHKSELDKISPYEYFMQS